ncbi:MAG: hypothetical protein WAL98_14410 [Desulfatiglandaceae bacterium]|jgi:UDPglucose--hexose-1-phosphate uridylyltransferase
MELGFKKEIHEARFLDPTDGFQEKVIRIEVRTDLFTGSKARVLAHRWRLPEASVDEPSISKSKEWCPFCPGKMEASTPKFPSILVPKGRIRYGEATVVPNAFPYSRYNAVCILSKRHYLPLDHFDPEILYDAFEASLHYIESIRRSDNRVAHASINWNYMPAAGGGIIHPHFQIVVDEKPTKFHRKLLNASSNYHRRLGRSYWADLIAYEEKEGVRHIFRCGGVTFLSSFSPEGMLGEVLVLFGNTRDPDGPKKEGWKAFCEGLSRLLACFHRMHCGSLNMTLFPNLGKEGHFRTQARIIPRTSIPPLGISDVNYFEKGHDEVITIISPEELTENIRALL